MGLFKGLGALALCALLVGALTSGQASAGVRESHIYTNNKSDAYAWISGYSYKSTRNDDLKIQGSWCVPPHSYDKHGLSANIGVVRAEVSMGGCQRHLLLNTTRLFHESAKVREYTVSKNGDRYEFGGGFEP